MTKMTFAGECIQDWETAFRSVDIVTLTARLKLRRHAGQSIHWFWAVLFVIIEISIYLLDIKFMAVVFHEALKFI